MSVCVDCGNRFDSPPEFLAFLKGIGIDTAPENCPACRHRARSAFRNERVLYRRPCGQCGKDIVTVFSGDRKFPVFCPDCWYSDKWDGLEFGKEFDFSQPFFDQFRDLQDRVPRLCLNNAKHENSEYCNQCVGNKNCYLLFAADDNEDSLYGYWINRCKDTVDCSNTADSTLCYRLIDCEQCYQCVCSQDLINCSDCHFCFDLIGCHNCIRSAGLRNKSWHVDNRPVSKEEYRDAFAGLRLSSFGSFESEQTKFSRLRESIPHKYKHIVNSENCTGDYISKCKDCFDCYDIFESEKCRYAYNLVHKHYNNTDVSYVTETKNAYQVTSSIGENFFLCTLTWYSSDVWYCDLLRNSHDCFGCIGLRRNRHCILNRQYSKEEYDRLVPEIIEHMKNTGEWGEFFPCELSPFAYNETVACDEFPLSENQAARLGYRWKRDIKEPSGSGNFIPAASLPDDIEEIPDEILSHVIGSAASGRPFKIIKPELDFYRKMRLPLPRLHPDERYLQRKKMRNPRTLWNRKCMGCGKEIRTTYSPQRKERVLCEICYSQAIY